MWYRQITRIGALILGSWLLVAQANTPGADNSGLIGTRVVDLEGNLLQLGMDGSVLKPAAFTVFDPACPLSDVQRDQLRSNVRRAREEGFLYYGVIPGQLANHRQAVEFAQRSGLGIPILLDGDLNLVRILQPRAALDSVMVSDDDEILYRGGAALPRLRAAQNKGNPEWSTPPSTQNCELAAAPSPEQVTYHRHVAGLLQANCVECHRANGIGPFPLTDYAESRPLAAMIAYVTAERIMPPWKATPGSGHYLNERLLSEHQIALLDQWAKGGAPEGRPEDALPPPRVDTSEWRLGEPDIVISMPVEFEVPAAGPDIYRYFVVENAIPEDLEIAAIDFLPGDASVVHHSNFFVDYGGKARKQDAEDPAPGFSVFGTGGFFSYWDSDNTAAGLGAWAPGGNPVRYPDGMGIQLPGGADFIFEIHYHPTGKKATDRSRLGIYLADKPIKKPVTALFMGTDQVDIPPGTKNYKRHFYMELPADMSIVDIGPHMHYLGTHAEVKATLPDGDVIPLLDVAWDFRWQGAYYYRKPLFLPKGTRIDAITTYDNSADNPYNPYDPPVRATWGWGTDQEMGELYITVLVDNDWDGSLLQGAAQQSWIRPSDPDLLAQELSTAEIIERLRFESTWESGGESLMRLLVSDQDRLKEANRIIKKGLRKEPRDARLHMVSGSLNAILAGYTESTWSQYSLYSKAAESYERALELDGDLWDARFGLAIGLAEEDNRDYQQYAEQQFLELIRWQEAADEQKPIYAMTYTELGDLYQRMGRPQHAAEAWARGARLHPGDQRLIERLGLAKKGG